MSKQATFGRVTSRPPIDREALQATAGASWTRIDVVDSTASTNLDLLADDDAPDRCVLVAEMQTAGRGRLDRTWTSPRGAGLTFSVLLRPAVPAATWGWLPLLAGVALHDAISAYVPVRLKWPNDLLDADGGKLAGILAQTAGAAVVIGIGLNVTTRRDELPVPTASSLALLNSDRRSDQNSDQRSDLDRTALLGEILTRIAARYESWSAAGGDAEAAGTVQAYRVACATIGSDVEVQTPGGELRGRAVAVDAGGRLVLKTGDQTHTVAAGDVTHVR